MCILHEKKNTHQVMVQNMLICRSICFNCTNAAYFSMCSYSLFKMFDDLVILAKGLIVYLGPVKKVEEYFSGFGIDVPERVNPPDYFIDILEGIIKPPGINVGELPLRWMVLNGYDVPPYMQQNLGAVEALQKGDEASSSSGRTAGGVWNGMKNAIEHIREHIEQNLSKAEDLSNRRTPGVLQQYRFFLGRYCAQLIKLHLAFLYFMAVKMIDLQ